MTRLLPRFLARTHKLGVAGRHNLGCHTREIAADPALRMYGMALALVNALTAYWFLSGDLAPTMAVGADAICWPLLPVCDTWRVLDVAGLNLVFRLYGVASVAVAVLFGFRRRVVVAYAGLFALTLLKVGLLALDFRLRRNQHYMALAATSTFLLVPNKRQALRLLIVLFYFWAGTLKLNREWLSGAGLYRPLWFFSGRGVELACAYVVLLELAMVWALLARRQWLFWGALGQVLLFHLFSWPVVGYFYPLVMFGLLSLFPLCRLLRPEGHGQGDGPGMLGSLLRGGAAPATYLVAGIFSALQLVPHLYPGDSALTGEGRLFALHMFDARVLCNARGILTLTDGQTQVVDLHGRGGRTACDPVVVAG
ncbi:MAG: hypothetical protein H7X95_12270, partial [Deltaproteobacteria bacterium]|nr:hypothetical protein [Deltaproteobacteria bacterium]